MLPGPQLRVHAAQGVSSAPRSTARRPWPSAAKKDYKDIVKNCYYLLGEINLLMGNEDTSDHYFGKLQECTPTSRP